MNKLIAPKGAESNTQMREAFIGGLIKNPKQTPVGRWVFHALSTRSGIVRL